MLNDIRFAVRALRRNSGFTIVAALTLALGIGANTALFSVADAVLFKPLPYPAPDRIIQIDNGPLRWTKNGFGAAREMEQSPLFAGAGIFVAGGLNVGGEPYAERVRAAAVSEGFFAAMGTAPIVGRPFTREEAIADARVAVIGEDLWRRRLGANPALGSLLLNGQPYTVAGVMPSGYSFPREVEVWITSGADRQIAGAAMAPLGIARLADGITINQAVQGIEHLLDLRRKGPRDPHELPVAVTLLRDELIGSVRPLFGIMAAAVALVLLVACMNVANLLLARVSAREREMSVRRALGASRARLVRYLFCESALLAAIAGVIAIPAALWTLEAMRLIIPPELHGSSRIVIDHRAAAVTAVLCVASALLFGLAPSLSIGAHGSTILRSGTATASPFWRRFRGSLVAAELAAALILLAGSATIVKTVSALLRTDLGASGDNALTLQLTLPSARYGTGPQIVDFYARLDERLHAIPGVEAAGASAMMPGSREMGVALSIEIEGLSRAAAEPRFASHVPVSPGYFRALGIELVAGRPFTASDRDGAPRVVIVSEGVARVYGLAPQQLIGRRHAIGARKDKYFAEIVGVVRNVRHRGPESPMGAQLYQPFAQSPPFGTLYVALKTAKDPRQVIGASRRAVSEVDADLPPYNVRTFDEIRSTYVADRRFAMVLMLAFGALTALLAAIGLYGVMSYLVQLRRREIGIRVALGATPRNVLRETMKSGLVYAVLGIGAGAALAGAASRVFISRITGLQQLDAGTLALSAALMLLIAVLTAWFPALRAGRIDPVVALRLE